MTSEFWLLIIIHIYIVVLFDLKSSVLREVSAYPRGTKAVLVRLAKFLLEALRNPQSAFHWSKSGLRVTLSSLANRASKRNFARRTKTALVPRG
jgi:hypothetical protein